MIVVVDGIIYNFYLKKSISMALLAMFQYNFLKVFGNCYHERGLFHLSLYLFT